MKKIDKIEKKEKELNEKKINKEALDKARKLMLDVNECR